MERILIESGIIVLLVLIGISVFIPDEGNSTQTVITEFENSIESGNVIEDGIIEDVDVSIEDSSNFIARVNCKIASTIVKGLNSIFDIGIKMLRKVIN